MRVLLADSNELLLKIYKDFLWEYGLEVITASTGLDCIAKLRQFHPDVLVLEDRLLWGGAHGVLERMYAEADIPLAAVVVLSSNGLADECRWIADFPVDDLLFKPLRPGELLKHILRIERGSRKVHGLAEELAFA